MRKGLLFKGVTRLIFGAVLTGLLLFLPAGTMRFSRGWLFMAVLFIPVTVLGVIMMLKKTELLEKRLKTAEKHSGQRVIVALCGVMLISGFICAGLDFRYGRLFFGKGVAAIAVTAFLLGYLLYAKALQENTFLSRVVEIQENHRVIDTGVYRVIRHPMYAATLILFLSMPLILGSLSAFIIFLVYPILIIARILGEERVLERELEGYAEYRKRVRYRLIPFIW